MQFPFVRILTDGRSGWGARCAGRAAARKKRNGRRNKALVHGVIRSITEATGVMPQRRPSPPTAANRSQPQEITTHPDDKFGMCVVATLTGKVLPDHRRRGQSVDPLASYGCSVRGTHARRRAVPQYICRGTAPSEEQRTEHEGGEGRRHSPHYTSSPLNKENLRISQAQAEVGRWQRNTHCEQAELRRCCARSRIAVCYGLALKPPPALCKAERWMGVHTTPDNGI